MNATEASLIQRGWPGQGICKLIGIWWSKWNQCFQVTSESYQSYRDPLSYLGDLSSPREEGPPREEHTRPWGRAHPFLPCPRAFYLHMTFGFRTGHNL